MRLLAISFVFLSLGAFSQKNEFIQIDSLPKEGILLDKSWKWHAGDNPDFAKADFDDSKWESVDPTRDIDELTSIKKAGYGWLRLKIKANLPNTILGLMVNQQMVASEIFCNGKRIAKFGKISANQEKIVAYNPSGAINGPSQIIYFYTDTLSVQTIAIRYAIQPNISGMNILMAPTPFLNVTLNKPENLNENNVVTRGYFDSSFLDHFEGGLFFILALMHLLFFYHYKTNITNLYFGLFCIFSTGYFLIQAFIFEFVHISFYRYLISFPYYFFYIGAMMLLLLAVYSLFNHPKKVIFKLLNSFFIFCLLLIPYDNRLAIQLLILLLILVNLEVGRISLIALKEKKRGSFIICIGAFIYAISTIIYMTNEFVQLNILTHEIIKHTFYNLANVSLPICITIFLSTEFANTTKSLEIKLSENESLFAEKQQILATQKEILEKQVKERTAELVASQNQLIQSEKLASLGELTAGIAHEIQNPLNFVNNFSELSVELIKEIQDERQKTREERDEALEDELLSDLSQNQSKINHHGKRASSIVSGMLEHSRASTGERVLTDINKLADEYLRLSYHGIRAKDSNFNSDYQTDFDENLPKIEVIPQDMGRVLLNLINNAFWAVKTVEKPLVTVKTEHLDNQIIIKVSDNGTGMTDEVKAKIFQPFFTTKPTGQGTGLGLSLAYDIVTKGHGGTIEVESSQNIGSAFVITIPIQKVS